MSYNRVKDALVIVADGEKAIVFKNTSNTEIKLKSFGEMPLEYLGDKGPSGLPPETTDKEKGEATFAKHIATDLNNRVKNDKFEHLILIADPQTLGQIRANVHEEVTKRLIIEIPKTLTNSTVEDIEKTIEKELN